MPELYQMNPLFGSVGVEGVAHGPGFRQGSSERLNPPAILLWIADQVANDRRDEGELVGHGHAQGVLAAPARAAVGYAPSLTGIDDDFRAVDKNPRSGQLLRQPVHDFLVTGNGARVARPGYAR